MTESTSGLIALLRHKFPGIDADIDQSILLGQYEAQAEGTDEDAAIRLAVQATVKDLRNRVRTHSLDWPNVLEIVDADTVSLAGKSLSRPRLCISECGRRRIKRDAVIVAAHRGGVTQRTLAEVFGLARSRIAVIIATFRHRKAHHEPPVERST